MSIIVPDMQRPEHIASEQFRLKYHDGAEREVYVTDMEYLVSQSSMIVSRTDKNGIITHVNSNFIDASGYEKEELIGRPQYILRHPHMPKAPFKDLWETLQRGDTWVGVVKNLRKDGGFYWVQAVVKPMEDGGYHSVRKRLDRAKIEEYIVKYREMRAAE